MQISFNTQSEVEVQEVLELLSKNKNSVAPDGVEAPKEVSETQSSPEPKKTPKAKPTQKAKVEPEAEKVEETQPESTITLTVLKDSAKNAVGRTDRAKVKDVISEFAGKLAEVKEKDFGKLYKKLQELGR